MRHARLAFVVGIIAVSGVLRAAQAPADAVTRLDQRLKAAVERGDVPGVVALAADRNGIIYSGAFGARDAGQRRPMAADTIFRIASMTKAVTSAALMQLVDQRRVALDDPADKYLPGFRHLQVVDSFSSATGAYTVRPAPRPPTVPQLLPATPGPACNFVSPTGRDFKPRDVATFHAGPLAFHPG